ncbi:MAG TPA: tetratricopeptide repeat protein [Pirellulaceae bacterium]|nr:tetratricopeptide repeat protein [Pirellulaceae bacterium]
MNLPAASHVRWAAAAIAVIGALAFASGFDGEFVLDDFIAIPHDSQMHRVWPWGPIGDVNRWFGVWTFQLNYALGGNSPLGYHLVNIAIHVAAGLTLFDLARRMLLLPGIPHALAERSTAVALIIALVWLVHPLQTQAVTYVIQRYESLMGLCFLLVLYCTLRGAKGEHARRWYLAAATAAWAGAGSKEVMLACPLVLMLFDRAFLAASWREVLRRRGMLHTAVLATGAWLIWASRSSLAAGGTSTAGFGFRGVTPWEYLRSQAGVILHYLRLAVWPDELILDRGWPVAHAPLEIYGCGAIVLLLLFASIAAWFRWPRISWLGLAFFFVLAPTSSINPIADLAVEHRMYLPLAAVVALAVLAIARLPVHGRFQWGLATLIIAALFVRTTLRNRDYADPIGMWRQVVDHNPDHARGYRMLAAFLAQDGQLDQARRMYAASIEREPRIFQVWIEYGNVFFQQGDYAAAIERYTRATRLNPKSYRAWMNIGRCQLRLGDYCAATSASRAALAALPDDAAACKQLAWLLATAPDAKVRDGAAALSLVDAIRQNPRRTDIQWHEVRAAALAELGRFDEATLEAARAVAAAESIRSKRLPELKLQLAGYQGHQPWRPSSH